MYKNLFWFNYFKPDMEINIKDKRLIKWVKRLELEVYTGLKGVLFDPTISQKLNAFVFYISKKKMELLKNILIYRTGYYDDYCPFNIKNSVKLNFRFGSYIFILSGQFSIAYNAEAGSSQNPNHHCLWVQKYHDSDNISFSALESLSRSLGLEICGTDLSNRLEKMPPLIIWRKK